MIIIKLILPKLNISFTYIFNKQSLSVVTECL